jgi:hypothetical protein
MSIRMRIVQRFAAGREREFMALERQFAALEAARPDYPKGRRLQPIAAADPSNTLVWEADFPDLDAARCALDFFAGDVAHERLLEQQREFFAELRTEFYQVLEMP